MKYFLTSIPYICMVISMALKKKTIFLSEELLAKAQRVTGTGITQTIRMGLELVAAREAYDKMMELKGKYKSSINIDLMRQDR